MFEALANPTESKVVLHLNDEHETRLSMWLQATGEADKPYFYVLTYDDKQQSRDFSDGYAETPIGAERKIMDEIIKLQNGEYNGRFKR